MNILHTVAPAEFGGLEEVVIRLASGLAERGNRVTVACIFTGEERPHPFVEALVESDVDCVPMFFPPRTYQREISALHGLCERLRPDVVHTHGYRPDVLHRKVTRERGIPSVTTLHGFTGGGWKNRLYERLQLRAVRTFDAVVAVSRPMADLLRARRVPARVLHVIPNAWRARRPPESAARARAALGTAPERFHVGWVGRLSHEKAPDLFLDAVAQLSDVDLDVSIIGDGHLRGELERRARKIDSADIRFHGAVPEAGRLFSAFDLLVLSSRTEGTPIVLFEAMAASVPVVATAVGGVPDVVDAVTAILVPAGDPAALARAIESVYRERGAAKERASQAERRVRERFATGPWLERYENLYSTLTLPQHADANDSSTPPTVR